MPQNTLQKLEKARANRDLSIFDITSIDDLSDKDIAFILELADIFQQAKTEKLNLLHGKTIITAFYEDSTRTRMSFELAAKHLGADTAGITSTGSSVKKGESTLDTTQTLAALQAQVLVIRSAEQGLQQFLAKHVSAAIINAGDGWHEHPSQGLLDAKTMLDHHKTLKGKILTIVGDVKHSRVFGSLVRIAKRLGATIRIAAPQTLLPVAVEQFGVEVFLSPEKALKDTDIVYALRVQEERGAKGYIPSLGEYAKHFCITPERLSLAKKNAILMHAGPVIRDVDLSAAVMTDPRCKVLTQVENGLAVRKALLWLLADRRDGKSKGKM